MPEVEFQPWETSFKNGDITILEVRYGNGGACIEDKNLGIRFKIPATSACDDAGLFVRLFHLETRTVFRIVFEDVSAFRVLDEHGLTELWQATSTQGGRPDKTTFKVRGHAWPKESPVSFVTSNGWSFVIATDWTCVEVVCKEAPRIEFDGIMEPESILR